MLHFFSKSEPIQTGIKVRFSLLGCGVMIFSHKDLVNLSALFRDTESFLTFLLLQSTHSGLLPSLYSSFLILSVSLIHWEAVGTGP